MGDYSKLKELAEEARQLIPGGELGSGILALLAEHEQLRAALGGVERDNNRISGELATLKIKSGDISKGALVALEMLEDAEVERDQLRVEADGLRRQIDTLTEWYANALNVITECSDALPGAYYMDPPDGGDVPVPEQLRRMAKDAERYRWLRLADWWDSPICAIVSPKQQAKPGTDCPSRDRLDAAIDAAMAKEAQHG